MTHQVGGQFQVGIGQLDDGRDPLAGSRPLTQRCEFSAFHTLPNFFIHPATTIFLQLPADLKIVRCGHRWAFTSR
jgi:hypothetical protein